MSKFDKVLSNFILNEYGDASTVDSANPQDVSKQILKLATIDPKATAEVQAAMQGKDPATAIQQKQDAKSDPAHSLLSQLASDPNKNIEHIDGIDTADSTLLQALNKRGLTFYNSNQTATTEKSATKTPESEVATTQQNKTEKGGYPGVNA